MLDANNINKAVEMSLLSRIQAEIYVISYPLPVTGRRLWYLTMHPDKQQCLNQSSRVDWHRNIGIAVGILFVSWDPCYIRSVSRHCEYVWAWLIILRHLRHKQEMCLGSPTSRWKSHTNSNPFLRYWSGAARAPPAVYVTKIGPLIECLNNVIAIKSPAGGGSE